MIRYREIVSRERVNYDHVEPGDDVQFAMTVTFEPRRQAASIAALFSTAEARDQAERQYRAIEGAQQTIGRLAEYVEALAA